VNRRYTPPRDLDNAVAAARGWEPSEIFARMHAARKQAAKRRRWRRFLLASAVAVAIVVLIYLIKTVGT
jgi:hypothetical protein